MLLPYCNGVLALRVKICSFGNCPGRLRVSHQSAFLFVTSVLFKITADPIQGYVGARCAFNFVVRRKQIPLGLCYATTANGCQGLTIQKLGLDLRRSVFSYGQLYSAVPRVSDSKNVLILKYGDDDSASTSNIVWKELLL
jgi:hypothetical protein